MELESITRLLAGYDNALFGSFIVSVFIIIIGKISLRYSSSEFRSSEVQTSHVGETPRTGGIAIVSGCICCWWVTENFSTNYLGYIVLSGLPVLILGLLDDLHFKVRPLYRLLGAAISSLLAVFFSPCSISLIFLVSLFFNFFFLLVSFFSFLF